MVRWCERREESLPPDGPADLEREAREKGERGEGCGCHGFVSFDDEDDVDDGNNAGPSI